MKKFIVKFLFLISFILLQHLNVYSAEYTSFSSVTYDNSSAFLTLNSKDNSDLILTQKPTLNYIEGENTVYFDIPNAVLNCPNKDFILKTDNNVNEIIVLQQSIEPQTVRVQINYKPNFNPKNISLRMVGNTLFVHCFIKLLFSKCLCRD